MHQGLNVTDTNALFGVHGAKTLRAVIDSLFEMGTQVHLEFVKEDGSGKLLHSSERAFKECGGILEGTLDNVDRATYQQFSNLPNLRKGAFNGTRFISKSSFADCPSLAEVIAPDVEEIGDEAFKDAAPGLIYNSTFPSFAGCKFGKNCFRREGGGSNNSRTASTTTALSTVEKTRTSSASYTALQWRTILKSKSFIFECHRRAVYDLREHEGIPYEYTTTTKPRSRGTRTISAWGTLN